MSTADEEFLEVGKHGDDSPGVAGGFEELTKSLRSSMDLDRAGIDLSPAKTLEIRNQDWGRFAAAASKHRIRWVAAWGDERPAAFHMHACFESRGDYLIVRTSVHKDAAELPSQAQYYWAAERCERHIQDLYGIRFVDHPDPRRWTRHQAWPEGSYPLRKSFPVAGLPATQTPPDCEYPFVRADGAGVYEIPVGPVHAGIIEPGHFRFQAVGETVLNLEERLGYVHKGIEKIAEGRDAHGLARLAGRISGDTTVAHTWAACLAMEHAAGIEAPLRAAYLRAIVCERERILNHVWDMAGICNDVAYAFAYFQFGRLREVWMRENHASFGHRLAMDYVVPGGVLSDLSPESVRQMQKSVDWLENEVDTITSIADFSESLEDRLVTTGIFPTELAEKLGALGYLGRASGLTFDVRKDAPYPPYDRLDVTVPCEDNGDVAARFWIRYKEIKVSCGLLRQLLAALPDGELRSVWKPPAGGGEGIALVEGWRGEILSYVRFDEGNRIARFYPRDPSRINWPSLEKLILGNIVPDFPVCNKSVNGSYSGQDL